MRRSHVTAHLTALGLGLSVLGVWNCSSSGLNGASGTKKSGTAASNDQANNDNGGAGGAGGPGAVDANPDDEAHAANQPIQVSGAFLTVDCGPAKDGLPNVPSERETIGCAFIDTQTKQKLRGHQLLVSGVTFGFQDKTIEKATMHPAPKTSEWHVFTTLVKGHINDVIALAARGAVESHPIFIPSSLPRTYNLDGASEAAPPAGGPTIFLKHADFPPEPHTSAADIVIDDSEQSTGSSAIQTSSQTSTKTTGDSSTATATQAETIDKAPFTTVKPNVTIGDVNSDNYVQVTVKDAKAAQTGVVIGGTGGPADAISAFDGTGWNQGQTLASAGSVYVIADLSDDTHSVSAIQIKPDITDGTNPVTCDVTYRISVANDVSGNDLKDGVDLFSQDVSHDGTTRDTVFSIDFPVVQARYWKVEYKKEDCTGGTTYAAWQSIAFYTKKN